MIVGLAISWVEVFFVAGLAASTPQANQLPEKVEVLIEYKVELPRVPRGAKVVKLWVPIPRDDREQTLLALRAPGSPTLTRHPAIGNRYAYYEFSPASRMPTELTLEYHVARQAVFPDSENWQDPSAKRTFGLWLGSQRLLPVEGKAKSLSTEIVKGATTDLSKARKIYQYVFANMAYDKQAPGWGNADFQRACQIGKGNCTDFHVMFLFLCRAQGIPSRFEIGLEFATDGSTRIPGEYHCWASFYTKEQGWIPVDISTAWKRSRAARQQQGKEAAELEKNAGFGGLDAFRVGFSRGLDIEAVPAASSTRRYIIDPVLEIDGIPVKVGDPKDGGFRRTWSYKFVKDTDT